MQNMLEICGITLEDLRDLYGRELSIYRVQKKLGVSRPTVTKWLRIAGVKTLGHRRAMAPTTSMSGEFGAVAKWIRDNPGAKLPYSVRMAAQKIGCSEKAVRSYLYRRKTRVIKFIDSMGDLRSMPITVTTVDGKNIKASYIDSYHYKFDPRTYRVRINASIKNAHFQCDYPLKELLTLFRSVK